MADQNAGSRSVLVTLRRSESVDYFMTLRPHSITGISIIVLRSLSNKNKLHDVTTEYCLITKTGCDSRKLDTHYVRRYANHWGTVKTMENVDNEYLIHFEE